MDISQTKTATGAARVESQSPILQRLGSAPVVAKVIEVIRLDKPQIQQLLEQKALPQTLLQELHRGHAVLVKLQLATKPTSTTWTLTNQDLSNNTLITVARKGEALVIITDKAATDSSTRSNNEQPSRSISLNQHQALDTHSTKKSAPKLETMIDLQTMRSAQSVGRQELALLNQLARLTLPAQDKSLQFFSSLRPDLASARPELLNLSSAAAESLYTRAAKLVKQLDNWQHQLPRFANLTPDGVRQALSRSGLFTEQQTFNPGSLRTLSSSGELDTQTTHRASEANVRHPASDKQNVEDLKSLLLSAILLMKSISSSLNTSAPIANRGALESIIQLLFTHRHSDQNRSRKSSDLSGATKALEQLASASLARIIFNQSNSLQASQGIEAQGTQYLNADFLLRHNDQNVPVHLSLREQAEQNTHTERGNGKSRKTWVVFLEWEFSEVGAYHSEIRVKAEEVSVKFWVENSYVKQRFIDNISTLRKTLEDNGIQVSQLTVEASPLLKPQSSRQGPLIDVRT